MTIDLAGGTVIARYQGDGSIDQQFGFPFIGFGTSECYYAQLTAVAIDSSDRIVATGHCAGTTFEGPGLEVLTVRTLPDGHFDPTFGELAGAVLSHFGSGTQGATSVVVDALSNITIAGFATECRSDMLVARYDASGNLDPHFGFGGPQEINFGDPFCTNDRGNAMTTDAEGRFVIAGNTIDLSGNSNFAIARVLTNRPDFKFSSPVAPIAVAPGGSGSTRLRILSIDGFHEPLKIAPFYGVPAGFTWSFPASPGMDPQPPAWGLVDTTFAVDVSTAVVPGTYVVQVFDARKPDPDHTAVVTVNVAASPFSFDRTINEFAQAGFIDNAGVAHSLTSLLHNATSSLERGNVNAARGQLQALKNHVEAQAGKHIATVATDGGQTINPAAILIANIDDLIRQIGTP
jgi:hypothetical protein